MRATATKAKTIPTPTTMATTYPPEVAEVVVSNSSKKKKKKKGKGRALDADQQRVVGAIRGPTDAQVDGEDEGIDDDDDLPALESTGDHHSHHNHYHHHHHNHPDHNHPHINHNYHHHGHRRTGLSPELESVHLNTTAKLNASAQAALRMTSTASAQAELLAAANELYRRMESETRDPIIDGGGRDGADSNSSEYWAQLPNHIRSFVQTTYAHGAAMSASERQKSEAMLALAQTMVDEAHSRAGFGSAPGVGPPSFDPALLSDPEFQRIVAMSRLPRSMNRFDEYAGEEYYSDNEDLDELEGVEREQRQQYESTNDGTTNATSKKKKKKKKKGGAAHHHLEQTQQPTQPTQTHPSPPSTPNPTSQPHPPSMPAVPTITRAPPSAAQPPPSSRAAGKQPVYNANLPSSTATTTNPVRTNSTSTARSTTKHPPSTTNKPTTALPTNGTSTTSTSSIKEKSKLWSNSSEEERERIKEFWLGLSEVERRDLVKLEKEAVLKKMKEQQKHSCSCAVCGRKRNAIEEELEVLYDAYYEELEQYANHQQQFLVSGGKITPPPGPGPFPGSVALDSNGALVTSRQHAKHANNARVNGNGKVEYDEEEYDEEEEEYEEDDDPEEDEASDEDGSEPPLSKAPVHRRGRGGAGAVNGRGPPRRNGARDDFLNFGSLTAAGPGNILTVADDLLKNDGQKFLEMMEQLAERRMQREEEAAREVEVDSEEDDEEDGSEDDEDEDDGEDDESEEEDEVLSEEQKMEEGRRMFSIFAARMFEQRVLNAYRERVASRRQEEFLKELEDEGKLQAERDARKQKENQKKKDKKKMQKLAKEAEKAKKDAEKAAEEAALKAKQEAAEDEARKKREDEKAKREAERKTKEEERARQAEERRQRIAEQKAIEAEKRREREERERKEKLARQERESQQRAEKAERERKAREERLAKEARDKEEREKKEKEEKERKEKERVEREKADQKKKEGAAAAIAAANAAAAANSARVKAAQQAAQVQAQMQSPNQPPISPRSGSFPPGTIGSMQNNKQKAMPPTPNAKMPSIVAGPSVPRQPGMPLNLARPPPPQSRPMMPPPHPMGGPPPMNIPIPSQIPIMPMGFNPHASPIAMSPSGRFPPGQPFGAIAPFGHVLPPSQVQQQPMMNGNMRNYAAHGPMDFPPPTPFDQPQQSQQVTPVLGPRSSLPGPSCSTTPSSSKLATNGLLPQGLTGAPGPNNGQTTSPPPGLPPVHSRRQSASIPPAPFGPMRTIGKPSPSTIAFGPSSVIGDDDRAIQPPSSRMRASMDDLQVLGSSALVDENDEIVDLSEIKRRGVMGGAVGPAAKNIWATNGTGKGGGWPAAPISSSLWSAPGFPTAPGGPARPPPPRQQAAPAPERLGSPFLPS